MLNINNKPVRLGEWYNQNEPIMFTCILNDTDIFALDIQAIDAYEKDGIALQGTIYYFEYEGGSVGFSLPQEYHQKLWDFLDSLNVL